MSLKAPVDRVKPSLRGRKGFPIFSHGTRMGAHERSKSMRLALNLLTF